MFCARHIKSLSDVCVLSQTSELLHRVNPATLVLVKKTCNGKHLPFIKVSSCGQIIAGSVIT